MNKSVGGENRVLEYIGVDIAKKKCVVCIMDKDGNVIENSSYPNTTVDALQFARNATRRYGECKAVVESTGNMWLKTYEPFESAGIEVRLANPSKVRVIAEAKIKTDRIDCTILAHLLRADLIPSSYVPKKAVRDSRYALTHRINIVRDRTRVENRIHSLLDKYDLKCEYTDMFGVNGMKWLHSLKLPDAHDQEILDSLIRQVEFLNQEEVVANTKIASGAIDNRYATIIMSMTGFDYYGASMLAAYIADINRFATPSRLVSWVGMCPSVHQTGDSLRMGHMKKDGNAKVRWIMTQAANVASKCDPRMKAYYERKLKRHNHNAAITHVANKMLKILWHMLRNDAPYNEKKDKLYRRKLMRMAKIAT